MRNHFITILLLICITAFLATAMSGCAAEIPLTTIDGTAYSVTSAATATQYAGRTPMEGSKFLLVTVQGTDSQLDNMQEVFFGSQGKAMVTDGTTEATCVLIVYAPRSGNKLDVVLLFQVPDTFSNDFTMYGDGFESVALSVDDSK